MLKKVLVRKFLDTGEASNLVEQKALPNVKALKECFFQN